jgi:hypothetical protein
MVLRRQILRSFAQNRLGVQKWHKLLWGYYLKLLYDIGGSVAAFPFVDSVSVAVAALAAAAVGIAQKDSCPIRCGVY